MEYENNECGMDMTNFMLEVLSAGEGIDEALAGKQINVCIPALTMVLGTSMSVHLVGQMPGCQTLESTMEMLTGSILAAYRDAERRRIETAS